MTNKESSILSLFILLAVFSFLPAMPTLVHASTGIVCLIDPSSTDCSSSSSTFSGSVGGQLRIAVLLQGSDLVNGFDITTIVDRSILKPVGVDLTGSILSGTSSPTILSECINGTPPFNAVCVTNIPSIPGTIEFSVGACPGCFATATTGLLFTEIYNISGTAPGIPVAFLTGCKQTSTPNTCVSLSNGTKTPVPETAQVGSFGNSSSPDFVITAYPNIVSFAQGTSTTLTISVISVSGFSGKVSLSALGLLGLLLTLSPSNVSLSSGQTANSTLTSLALGVEPGNIIGAITGTDGAVTHLLGIGFTVIPALQPDFKIVPNPFTVTVLAGSSATFAITVTSVNGFIGTVAMAASTITSGPIISLNATSATLTSGGNVTITLFVSIPNTTPAGLYLVEVTGNAGVFGHNADVSILVEDFVVSANAQIVVNRGAQANSNLTLEGVGGFAGLVNLSLAISPERRHGPSALLSTNTVMLSSDRTSIVSIVISTNKNTRPGTYAVRVTAAHGPLIVTTVITLVVTS